MRIGVLGINYKSAPLDLREKIAQACRDCFSPNKVVLSTCYRTEIYISQEDLAEAQSALFSHLKKQVPHTHEHSFYTFFGKECFFHLACVTAGLDSAMLAESDIQRQVKIAYEETRKREPLPAPIHYLFQKALKLGKTARSSFSLFQMSLHLEGMIYQLADQMLEPNSRLLFIGNSDINRKIIHHFWRKGKRQMTLCTRDLESAQPFALDYQLSLKDRSEIEHWHQYDGVIAATKCEHHLIRSAPKNISTRLMLDLSVPRSIAPVLKSHPHTNLINMEEIGAFFEHYHSEKMSEVESIKSYIESAVERYVALYERKSLAAHTFLPFRFNAKLG
jgi:glutamyl-tRNA reductase